MRRRLPKAIYNCSKVLWHPTSAVQNNGFFAVEKIYRLCWKLNQDWVDMLSTNQQHNRQAQVYNIAYNRSADVPFIFIFHLFRTGPFFP